jgi:hypothetical protein
MMFLYAKKNNINEKNNFLKKQGFFIKSLNIHIKKFPKILSRKIEIEFHGRSFFSGRPWTF